MPYAEVAVNAAVPHRRAFSYSLPEGMRLEVGQAVYVPFGRRTLQGIVVELPEIPSYPQTRDVLAPLTEEPILSPAQVALGRWISDEYLAPLFVSLALMLPPGFEQKPLTYVSSLVSAQEAAGLDLSPRQREALSLLLAGGRQEVEDLRKRTRMPGLVATLGQLERRGLVERSYGLAPPRVRRKVVAYYRLLVSPEEALARADSLPGSRPSRRADLLERLAEAGLLPLDVARRLAGGERGLRALEHGHLLRLDERAGTVTLSADAGRAQAEAAALRRTAVERAQAAGLRLLADEGPSLPASRVRARTGLTATAAAPLAGQGLIALEEVPVERDPLAGRHYRRRPPPVLTPEQQEVYCAIEEALEAATRGDGASTGSAHGASTGSAHGASTGSAHGASTGSAHGASTGSAHGASTGSAHGASTGSAHGASTGSAHGASTGSAHGGAAFLLHGVTGSGKTEVYLKALEKTVALGRRGIVLVPEIALTPQTVRRFAERFPGQVAVLHSGLSEGQLFDQWHGIRQGRYAVVVGSRSALFAPQPDLGLIVIDEEQEWTYKQEQAPRYHAREAARKLAELTGAILLLGSATPDVAIYQQALWGRYRLLTLRQRVRPLTAADGTVRLSTSEALPPVEVVDLRQELMAGNRSIFSRSLVEGVRSVLSAGEQAILFLNRRGAASFAQCRDCGYVPHCSSCAVSLTYHRQQDRLLCHQCNRGRRLPATCPQCGGRRLRLVGIGVERVEEEAAKTFPGARLLRWDRDVTRGRGAHERILARFLAREADILIGTQMVAKGLDLPAVTLVGVVSADVSLHLPDFRAGERTFQLLTQVAGRAGRAQTGASRIAAGGDGTHLPNGKAQPELGRVIIQTYTPHHYAIAAAAQHDYESFFAQEIELRRRLGYPPFSRLARLVYSHTSSAYAYQEASRLVQVLRQQGDARGLPDLEVVGPSPAYVARLRGRYRWQVLVRGRHPAELLADVALPQNWTVDIDPMSMA
jgi:primosomal protein N' (replication factor Y)